MVWGPTAGMSFDTLASGNCKKNTNMGLVGQRGEGTPPPSRAHPFPVRGRPPLFYWNPCKKEEGSQFHLNHLLTYWNDALSIIVCNVICDSFRSWENYKFAFYNNFKCALLVK